MFLSEPRGCSRARVPQPQSIVNKLLERLYASRKLDALLWREACLENPDGLVPRSFQKAYRIMKSRLESELQECCPIWGRLKARRIP